MIMKSSVGIFSAYSGCCCLCKPHYFSTTSSFSSHAPSSAGAPSTRRRPRWIGDSRYYANVASNKEHDLYWPKTGRPGAVPTPYEIFNLGKHSPYSKRRFLELVMLYHPDRSRSISELRGISHLPQSVRLERYRLIIAANNILSDPVKRSAYDRYGAGWNGHPEAKSSRTYNNGQSANAWGWQGPEEFRSASQNATWEDWERWYQRDKTTPQRPVFVSTLR